MSSELNKSIEAILKQLEIQNQLMRTLIEKVDAITELEPDKLRKE